MITLAISIKSCTEQHGKSLYVFLCNYCISYFHFPPGRSRSPSPATRKQRGESPTPATNPDKGKKATVSEIHKQAMRVHVSIVCNNH